VGSDVVGSDVVGDITGLGVGRPTSGVSSGDVEGRDVDVTGLDEGDCDAVVSTAVVVVEGVAEGESVDDVSVTGVVEGRDEGASDAVVSTAVVVVDGVAEGESVVSSTGVVEGRVVGIADGVEEG